MTFVGTPCAGTRPTQVNQDRFSAAVCVGSCGVYRRRALEPFGGVAAVAHSEDMYTGFKMTEAGYTVRSCKGFTVVRGYCFLKRRGYHRSIGRAR